MPTRHFSLPVDLSQDLSVNYLLIFFIIMVALAPLTHFLPSNISASRWPCGNLRP